MKKLITWITVLLFALSLSACDSAKQEQLIVFSFCGENEYFEISNGVIVLGDEEDVFDGGDLKILQTDSFSEVASYSARFYTMTNENQRILLTSSAADTTGNSVNLNGDLGRISGDSILTLNQVENIENLKNNLWFELCTTDVNGKTNTYQLQLHLTMITDNPVE